jgi:hypothetical protein
MSATTVLDPDIVSWLEQVTGMPLAGANRIPGGGTRQGWFVDLRAPDGWGQAAAPSRAACSPPAGTSSSPRAL